jgi:hypothetical protein
MTIAIQIDFMANGVHDRAGNLLSGGKIHTYAAGTNLPKATYISRDATPTNEASNPILLDGEGKANIYAAGVYKFVIQDAEGNTIRIIDQASYADQSQALATSLVISTATDPQVTVKNGAYETTIGLGSTGDTVIKPPGDIYIENAAPKVILDDTVRQVGIAINPSTGAMDVTTSKGLTVDNGVPVTLEPGVDGLGTQVLKVSKGLNIPTPFRVTELLDSPQILTDAGVTKIRGAWRFDSGGLSSITLLGTGAKITVMDGAEIETGKGFKPLVALLIDVFTPGTGWTISTGSNFCIQMFAGSPKQGFLVLNGRLTAGAAATDLLGTFASEYRIEALPASVEIPISGRTAAAPLSGYLTINASGTTHLVWDDGSAVAAGQIVYFGGVIVPMRS